MNWADNLRPWVPACVAFGAAAFLVATNLAAPADRLAEDALLRLSQRLPASLAQHAPDAAVVALDARSLRARPRWPWPRAHHAELVDALTEAGARAIAFDVDFATARADEDAHFARAIARSGRVALAAFRQTEDVPGVGELEIVNRPAPALRDAAAAVGHVVVHVDPDGGVRGHAVPIALGGEPTPSLARATLAIAKASEVEPDLATAPALRFDYRRATPEIPVLSAVDVLEGTFDRSAVAGRAVFIGATAAEFQDLWPTPVGPARPGVWIQAVAYRTLAAHDEGLPVLVASRAAGLASAAALAAFAMLLSGLSGRIRVAGFAVLAGCAVAGHLGMLVGTGLLISPLPGLVAVALQYAAGLEAVRQRLDRRLAERELSLEALFEVGATASQSADQGLQVGLLLLGEVVVARAVALLRARPDGRLSNTRLDWSSDGVAAGVAPEVAQAILRSQRMRVFSGKLPGGGRGVSAYVPLVAGATPAGVLVVERSDPRPLSDVELRTIATVASQLGLQARNLRLVEDLRATLNASVEAVASAVEARDGYTQMHCRRLAMFSVTMGRRLGLPEDDLEAIRLGALLHDVGKIGIRDDVLLKPGRLSTDERNEMERHTEIGHRIVRPIGGLSPATLGCVRNHHERWDGTGYPDALAGPDIPLGARIVSVVDVWDALSSDRPYKQALPQPVVLELLHKGRGTQFDPELLDLFFRVLDEEGDEMLALVAGSVGDAT